MYEKFFGLSHRPFAAAPNLECIVAHEGYVAARERLLQCLTSGDGTAVLTAPAGLGKSLLCQDIQSRLRGEFTVAYLCSAQFPNRKAMLQAILFELGAEYLGLSEDEARLCVIRAAQEAAERSRSLVVIVDEAHLVSTELLQELRAISQSSPRCATPVRLMLAGQLELEERLANDDLDAVNERIACHVVLEPLTQQESADYMHERLAMAAAKGELFTSEAVAFIVRAADGNPRALHQLCDHCLLSAYTIEEKPVSIDTARNSLDDLRALPLHWNDAGLFDENSDDTADEMEEFSDDEFVPTTETPPAALESGTDRAQAVETDRLETSQDFAFWDDSLSRGVIEVGGSSSPPVQASDAALFEAVSPWPAVPMIPPIDATETVLNSELCSPEADAEILESEPANMNSDWSDLPSTVQELQSEPADTNLDAETTEEASCEETAIELEAAVAADEFAAGLEEAVDADSACELDVAAEALAEESHRAIEITCSESELNVAEDVVGACAPEMSEMPEIEVGCEQSAENHASDDAEELDHDESAEDTAIETVWYAAPQSLQINDLSVDEYSDEELIVNDRYAALDRASEALSNYFPQAPELLQFLSQYAVNTQPRRGNDQPAEHAAHGAVQLAEPETDEHEAELLAQIQELRQQLQRVAAERPEHKETWDTGVVPEAFDVVEPPEMNQPATVVDQAMPAAEAMREETVEAAAEPVATAEPVRSRFAQLFSRMRQRRREVEDRLRRNADWI